MPGKGKPTRVPASIAGPVDSAILSCKPPEAPSRIWEEADAEEWYKAETLVWDRDNKRFFDFEDIPIADDDPACEDGATCNGWKAFCKNCASEVFSWRLEALGLVFLTTATADHRTTNGEPLMPDEWRELLRQSIS